MRSTEMYTTVAPQRRWVIVVLSLLATATVITATDLNGVADAKSPVEGFVPLSPARLLETRVGGVTVDGRFAGVGKVAAGGVLELVVGGRGGVAGDAGAVALNVTVTEPDGAGYVTVWPCGQERPNASNLNYSAGQTVPNAVLSQVGAGGKVCFYSQAATHLIVDSNGAFPAGSSFAPLSPARLLETRVGGVTVDGRFAGVGKVAAGGVLELVVGGRGGVAGDAGAVALNVTVTEPDGAGYVTVWPCGQERPNASNLNYSAGQTVPNAVLSQVGAGGKVCFYSQAATHLIVDSNGAFPAGSSFAPLSPARLLETRVGGVTVDGRFAGVGKVAAGGVLELVVGGRGGVAGDAGAVALNVTVTEPDGAGYVTVWPCGQERPNASNLNYSAGQTVPNAVLSQVGAGGKVCFYSQAATHLIVDANGAFTVADPSDSPSSTTSPPNTTTPPIATPTTLPPSATTTAVPAATSTSTTSTTSMTTTSTTTTSTTTTSTTTTSTSTTLPTSTTTTMPPTQTLPIVTAVSPSSGPQNGGTPVTVTGSGFTDATGVLFGVTRVPSMVVNSSTSITVSSPPGTGAVDVRVITSAGISAVNSADKFTYSPPEASCPSITTNVIWSQQTPILLSCTVSIPAGVTLTLSAGVVVKSTVNGDRDVFSVAGSLVAAGTSVAPVTITTYADDSVGGDTNGDGSASMPGISYSAAIRVQSGGSVNVAHAVLSWGSAGLSSNGPLVAPSSVSVVDSLFQHVSVGLSATGLRSASNVAVLDFRRNVFDGTPVEFQSISTLGFVMVGADMNVFTGGTAKTRAIYLRNVQVWSAESLVLGPANGAVYLAADINVEGALTLNAGTIVKSIANGDRDVFSVAGSLVAAGTSVAPVTITTYADDSVGGDTNGDNSMPGISYSAAIRVQSGGSVNVAHAVLSWGSAGLSSNGPLVAPSSVSVVDSLFQHVSVGLSATGLRSASNVAVLDFRRNVFDGTPVEFQSISTLGFVMVGADMNVFTGGTAKTRAIYLRNVQVWSAESLVLGPANGAVYLAADINVEGALTLNAGTIVKSIANGDRDVFSVAGSLVVAGTSVAPVTITTYADDSVGGDTNGDNSMPGISYSAAIRVQSGGSVNVAHAVLSWGSAGLSSNGPLVAPSSVSVVDSLFQHVSVGLSATGLRSASNVAVLDFRRNVFDGTPVEFQSISTLGFVMVGADMNVFTGGTAKTRAIYLRNVQVWSAESLVLGPANGAVYLAADINVEGALTLNAGTIVKSIANGDRDVFSVAGSLVAAGTSVAPVTITTYADDSVGGDTNGDNSMPGISYSAAIRVQSGGSVNVVGGKIRYAGTALSAFAGAALTFRGSLAMNGFAASGSQFGVIDARQVDWGTPSGPAPFGTGPGVNQWVMVSDWVGEASWRARSFGSNSGGSSWAGSSSGSYAGSSSRRSAGDPVDVATGNFSLALTDIVVPEAGSDLVFARSYNAQSYSSGVLGPKWRTSWETRLMLPGSTDLGTFDLVWGDGRVDSYTSELIPLAGNYTTLVEELSGFKATTKDLVVYRFDSSGALTSVTDSNGNTLTVAHDGQARVTSVSDSTGRALTFLYTASRLSTVTGPDGKSVGFAYDGTGRLVTVTDQAGHQIGYTYDSADRITSAIDANDHLDVSNEYDIQDRVVSQTDALGHVTSFAYGATVTTKTDPSGAQRIYLFDIAGHVLAETDATGYQVTSTYDSAGRPLTRSDGFGMIETFTYDVRGNVISHVDGAGRGITNSAYSASNLLLSQTDTSGATTTYTYDSRGNLLTMTDANGHVTVNTYSASGLRLTSTSPLGHQVVSTYNSQGDATTVIDALGHATTTVFDVMGRPTSKIDAIGGTSLMTYDAAGRTLTSTTPSSGTVAYTYDNAGQILIEKDALNQSTVTAYTANDQISTITDQNGGVTTFAYDVNGNLSIQTDPVGSTTTFGYDTVNRRTSTSDPTGATATTTFDGRGRTVRETDPLGNATTYTYDLGNAELTVTDASLATTNKAYDLVGRLVKVTDANGHQWKTAYDPAGQITTRSDPLSRVWTYTFNADGNLSTLLDAAGQTRVYTFDSAGRQVSSAYPNGTNATYEYDGLNRLISRTDASGTATYAYDGASRMTSATDGVGQTTTYTYDAAGRLSGRTTLGATATFGYDSRGNMTSVTDPGGNATWTYDAANNITSATIPNGVTLSVTYDAAHRPTTRTYARAAITVFSETISYDAAGRVTTRNDNTGNHTYSYGPTGRLAGDTSSGTTTTYAYDNVGNRTQTKVGTAPAEMSTYDSADQLTSRGTTTHNYDALGRLTTTTTPSDVTTFQWNANSHLTSTTSPAGTTNYLVDDTGMLIQEQIGATVLNYVYDTASNGVALLGTSRTGVVERELVGPTLYGQRTGTATTALLTDYLGSHRGSIGSSGTYTPIGYNVWGTTTTGASNVAQPGFAQGVVAKSGLLRFGQRFYDPAAARFITPEPNFLREQSEQLGSYVYAQDSPATMTDPTGLEGITIGSAWHTVTSVRSNYKKAKGWAQAGVAVWDATFGYSDAGSGTTSKPNESSRDSVCYADINVGKAHVNSSDLRSFDTETAGVLQLNANAYGGGLLSLANAGGAFSSGFLGANPTKVGSSTVKNGAKLVTETRSYADKQGQIVDSCLND